MPRLPPTTLLLTALVGCSELHDLQRADGGADAPAPDAPPAAPRPLSPLSTSTVTSQRPTLRWAPSPSGVATRVELCRDRACASAVTSTNVAGTRWRPDAPLAPGVYFWRLSRGGARSATWQFTVGARDAPLDGSRPGMLDLNGDGIADLAVSVTRGRAYVYLGDRAGLDARPAITLAGIDDPAEPAAVALADAGDVNGDGYGDLAVGAPWRPGGSYVGRAYVFHGGPEGVVGAPATTLDGRDGPDALFGNVAGAGDVNGDGYGDVFVGAPGRVTSLGDPTAQGHGYVYLGGPAGLATEPAITLVSTGFGNFGAGFAAGDFDGDGRVDLAVSAPLTGRWVGTVYVYLQPAQGFGVAPAPTAVMHGSGEEVEQYGAPLTVGDFDGDGVADLVAGAIRGRDLAGTYNAGRIYLYLGGASGLRAAGVVYGPAGAAAQLGVAPARAADVDGDGDDDLVAGAWGVSRARGQAYLYLGGPSGIGDGAAPALTLSGPDGADGEFGSSVALDDLNGDRLADVVVGADHVGGAGRAYLFLGRGGAVPEATPSVVLPSPAEPGGLFGAVVR